MIQSARTLVRLADELPKKSELRLREYRDSALESVKLRLFSPAPLDDGLEVLLLRLGLEQMVVELGADHAVVKAALQGKTPQALAEAVIAGTTLKDPVARKALFEGGAKAVAASKDPAIALARAYDAAERGVRLGWAGV